jgi:hypothetical protein
MKPNTWRSNTWKPIALEFGRLCLLGLLTEGLLWLAAFATR